MAAAMKFLLPLAALGAGLFAFTNKANAKPAAGGAIPPATKPPGSSSPSSPSSPVPTAATLAAIAAALATADPVKMREVAADLERQGFKTQAADLRKAADAVAAAMAQAPSTPPAGGVPPIVSPGLPALPGAGAAAPLPLPTVPQVDPAKGLAAAVNLEVASKSKGREDKELVRKYQLQELALGHTEIGKADGLYGPKSALSLAQRYGLVPTKPMYWPTNPTPAKQAYAKALLTIAAADPQRREEWQRAAKV